jgi:hypothetical protein
MLMQLQRKVSGQLDLEVHFVVTSVFVFSFDKAVNSTY